MDNFISRLEALLNDRKISNKQMCLDIGITTSAVTTWKKRNTIPSADVVLKIAKYLDVSLEYLITGEEKGDGKMERIKDIAKELAQEVGLM